MKKIVCITLLTIVPVALYMNFTRVNPSIDIAKAPSNTKPISASVVIEDRNEIPAVKEPSRPKEPTTTPLYLKLLGTCIADKEEESSASIRNLLTGITKDVKQGERIDRWTVSQIARGKVDLEKGGRTITLRLTEEPNKKAITILSPTQRLVNKAALSAKFNDLNRVLKAISVSLYCDTANNVKGIRIESIGGDEDRSLANKAGIEEGDVILSVNDRKTGNLMVLLGLYRKICNTSEVVVRINRDGTNRELTYYLN